jgi:hypothetical protein
VLISCIIPTYNFAVVPFILQLYIFFLQLYNFFAVVQFFLQLYNLLPNPMRFWTMLKHPILRMYVDLEHTKKGPSWAIPLSLSPKLGYLRQPSPHNGTSYTVRGEVP